MGSTISRRDIMKIEINIDIEDIVRQEIRTFIQEHLVINNVVSSVRSESKAALNDDVVVTLHSGDSVPNIPSSNVSNGFVGEYAPRVGKRRSKAEISMHELELELERVLTPEEKGKIAGLTEVDDNAEAKAKEDTITKARIDSIAAEATKAAAEELAEEADAVTDSDEAANDDVTAIPAVLTEVGKAKAEEEQIPKAASLESIDSLFL